MSQQDKNLKAFIRLDGKHRPVSGTVVLRLNKPKVGKWREVVTYMCETSSSTTTTSTTVNTCGKSVIYSIEGNGRYSIFDCASKTLTVQSTINAGKIIISACTDIPSTVNSFVDVKQYKAVSCSNDTPITGVVTLQASENTDITYTNSLGQVVIVPVTVGQVITLPCIDVSKLDGASCLITNIVPC